MYNESECIEAVGTDIKGYRRATISFAGRQWHFLQHRVAWEMATGRTAPADLVVMHTCDNPPCVNPAHLVLGTRGDNNVDKAKKGRGGNFYSGRDTCRQGHPLDGVRQGGKRRYCLTCNREWQRNHRIVNHKQRV